MAGSIIAALMLAIWMAAAISADARTMRVAEWNVSNYGGTDYRYSSFQTAIYGEYLGRSMSPDVMVCQEFTSQAGVNSFKQLLNTAPGSPGDWEAAPFINGNDTDSAFFYKTSQCSYVGYAVVFQATGSTSLPPRNIMRYDISVDGPDGPEYIALYSSHMKSGTSSSDQNRRLLEAQYIRWNAETLPQGWSFAYCGDTNVQNSSQAAYQFLVGSQANDSGRFHDPICTPGAWNNNSAFRFVHTQDPADATGGMDDRHDQILLSLSLVDGIGIDYLGNPAIPYSTATWDDPNHSYRAWGNDGTSYNTSLTISGNSMVGASIAQALVTSAMGQGHLPVFLDLWVPDATFNITGVADLGQYHGDKSQVSMNVELLDMETAQLTYGMATLGSDGSFIITGVAPGEYSVGLKPTHWLTEVVGVITISGSDVDLGVIPFRNGDIDDNNRINTSDYSALSAAMGSKPSSPNWNPMSDLDGSGRVNTADYSILVPNLGQLGDTF